MSMNEVRSNKSAGDADSANIDMKHEVVIIPVSDVDRAKEFYSKLGWMPTAQLGATFASSNSRLLVPAVQSNSA